jgi:3-isopropylmalate/(R)-2-methylmalate dehydratase small subunit
MIITGSVYKIKPNTNTDEIIPGRFLYKTDPEELAAHAFNDMIPEFQKAIKKTGIIVAGENFGCGSSREQAPIALKHTGVRAIIATSFARIFFRNALNIGLPVIELPNSSKNICQNDKLKINFEKGIIENLSKGKTYTFQSLPKWINDMIDAGGYINWSLQNKSID